MKRFRYFADGLFLLGCSSYALNRWCIKPHVHSPFMRYHFNDMLLMPCALPVLLWMERRFKLRMSDEMPTVGEIALNLLVWSILFEVIGPHIMPWTTGDVWDVAAYVAGGILAGLWWRREQVFALRIRG